MDTNRSNVLPLIELVGLKVRAVALAASTADAAVDVYCVCAWPTVANATVAAKVEKNFILLKRLTICTKVMKVERERFKLLCEEII